MTLRRFAPLSALAVVLLTLAGCATTPMGPTVNVMPGPNEPYSVFQQDQAYCQSVAQQQVGNQAQAANNKAVGTAAVTTVLGAALGAAIGGGHGAAIGAAAGAGGGAAYGANGSANAQYGIQQQYNNVYAQCMYTKGAQVPGYVGPGQGY
jgi:hypothetical protein